MNSLRKTILVTFVVTLLSLLHSGCNTMRGLGKDTEQVGEKIQEKATR